jgi:hypothetical protein
MTMVYHRRKRPSTASNRHSGGTLLGPENNTGKQRL